MFSKVSIYSLLLVLLSAKAFAATHKYQVKIDEKIEVAQVQICFDGKAPDYISIPSKSGNRDLISFPLPNRGSIEIQGRYWITKNLKANACLRYSASLKRHLANRTKESKKRKNIVFIEENTWLWLPEMGNTGNQIEISFNLPSWAEVSTPWQKLPDSINNFRLGNQPQEWGYSILIGDFDRKIKNIGTDSYLDIASVHHLENRDKIIEWLQNVANGLDRYIGSYPTKQTQIILISKTKYKSSPVPWARLTRGLGYGIQFVVVPTHEIEDFYKEITAAHEFSHQLLPKVHSDDIWLSEGLATYLQYVLLAQSGDMSSKDVWSNIYKGFQRGEDGTRKLNRESLKQTTRLRKEKGRKGRSMRLYWSGTLYFLMADVALREKSNGKLGLNDLLRKLNGCCLDEAKVWSGSELVKQLDKLADKSIFTPLYVEFSNGIKFPEYEQIFDRLGVKIESDTSQTITINPKSIATSILTPKNH